MVERLIHRADVEDRRRPLQRDARASSPGSMGGSVSKSATNVSGLPSGTTSRMSGAPRHRAQVALAQRLIDQPRDQQLWAAS
ncbi:MAG: hypothetical protein R2752_01640 [Vicinamibacterales bacterium]